MDYAKETKFIAFEPKKENRFWLKFPVTYRLSEWMVKSMSRLRYTPSTGLWDDLTIRFNDPINPSTSERIFELIKSETKEIPEFKLQLLGPVGDVVESWVIKNSKILSIDFADLNYVNDGLRIIELKLAPKTCILEY